MPWRSASLLRSPGCSTIVHSCPLGPLRPVVYSTTRLSRRNDATERFAHRVYSGLRLQRPLELPPRDVRGSRPAYQLIELPGYKAAPIQASGPLNPQRASTPPIKINHSDLFIAPAPLSMQLLSHLLPETP
jgi:hypothetical protein